MEPNWLNTAEYPFANRYLNINGQKVHYIDEGVGEVLLFIHGTPSWSFDFRNVIKILRGKYRCVALDHIGFGLSSKPADYDYSTRNHSATLEKFIAELGLKDLTLVVHDFGGPIGLDYALRNPVNITRLVVMNSWLWSSRNEPEFARLSRVLKSPLLPFLYRYLNFSARFILPASFGDKKLTGILLSQYTRPFASPKERKGTLAFAHSLLNDQDWFEELWQRKHLLNEKPVLFIWGMKDRVLGPKYLQKFRSGFPSACIEMIESAGHFPQEEEPGRVVAAIHAFLKSREG